MLEYPFESIVSVQLDWFRHINMVTEGIIWFILSTEVGIKWT